MTPELIIKGGTKQKESLAIKYLFRLIKIRGGFL